ncbi:four helix bundle protein [Flaviaesturariibacter flavus]|uniref:Four helix bundle protein n=1 Tax=Flaviaesturariibacter flavus TaxID=2502780 RepID=A0A4R1B4Y2_9BACT|nr:four helix bundle protein [Flaviaesturariibacter flavus]TCJ13011.1 four helix bundle protein [Flaviaesturariibacter flavus]
MNDKSARLEERLIRFAAQIISLCGRMPATPAGRHLSDQLLRSGNAPARQYGEAQGAESKADFLHKMKVGLKELRETYMSLRIVEQVAWFAPTELDALLAENNELISIFVASAKTASGNGKSSLA